MTTIAYKDGVIAYDSRQTRSGSIVSDDCQSSPSWMASASSCLVPCATRRP